ncbi:hypothetical protein [Plantactinospora sp. BB1]|uniref:hypothetical protein n=1 Tax=Plantactinospora sp. BB1 TaxID=2071627 RepID=UPI001F35DA7D|nr:hypothetical protein [Plantactinospora sp. BB1]
MAGLRPVVNDEQLALLRILVDRRRSLGEDHTRMVPQLHQLLLELNAGGAKKSLSAAQAKALLATVRPRDTVGEVRRRVATELIGDLERVQRRSKGADKELKELLASTKDHADGPGRHRTVWCRPAAGRAPTPLPHPQRGRLKIATWITDFCNRRRRHSVCDWRSPIDYERSETRALEARPLNGALHDSKN